LSACLIFFFLVSFLPFDEGSQVEAQRRPLLRGASRDRFAGRLLLIPRDGSPQSLQQPRLLAQLADHDLTTPPLRLAGKARELIAWAAEFDYAEGDGAIVSLDAIGGDAEAVKSIRAGRRGMPVYGFVTESARVQSALDLAAAEALDFLLIAGAGINAVALNNEIAARNLAGKVAVDDGAASAEMMLLARMLNRRFGFSPRLVPAYSLSASHDKQAEHRRLDAKSRAIGGWELPQTAEVARTGDVLLFLHLPQTPDEQRKGFVEALAQTIDKGGRVALVDLSESRESKEVVIAELRRRKLFDKLLAYASSDPDNPNSTGDAIDRAITQVSTFLVAIRFLRDDLARLRRIDRAQVTLLLNRYLSDWAYALRIRPALDAFVREQLKADPNKLGAQAERAEAFALDATRQIADEVFNEQFRHNAHALLLSRGERVTFELRALQRLHLRLPELNTSAPEIVLSIYAPQVTFPELPRSLARADWTLDANEADARIARRVDSIIWEDFKTNAETVEVKIKVVPQTNVSPESYRISAARRRNALRIDVSAPTQQGVFYALAKLERMGAEEQLVQDFQIAESPSFARRGIVEGFYGAPWSHRERLEMLRFLGRVRMNRYQYAPKDDPLHRERWRESYSGHDLERFQELVTAASENFVDLVYSINPGLSIAYSSEQDVADLIRKLEAMAALGVKHFALAFDDVPETLQREEDRAKFKSLAAAQAHAIDRVYEQLKPRVNGFELSIVPTVYSGARGDREYLKQLGAAIPADVLIFWTGPEVFSRELTDAQANEWRALIDRRPIVWDNFPVNDDKSWRLFLGPKRGVSPALADAAAGFIANPMGQMRASMLPLATVADYAWDARSYDPARALESALKLLYDERARAALRPWLQVYGDYHHDANLFEPLFAEPRGEIALPAMERQLAELRKSLESILATRDQGLLRGELAPFVDRAQSALERIKAGPAYEKLPNGNYRLRK
jgi:hypothetical protein